jgi:antitoxin component YwqK of YwqJK toxin-antitoxin module
MKFYIVVLGISLIISCQPARSDVFVEKVNPELANKLIEGSFRQTELSPQSLRSNYPLWIKGLKLDFKDSTKTTHLWYDEQSRITGMVEYKNGLVTDSIEFFQNGQRMFSMLFNAAGKPSGPARFYYENGRVREDGRFEDGRKAGIWRQFNPEGKLEKTNEYDRFGNPKR